MFRALRTASTRRLLAGVATLLVLCAAGAAIAVAAAGSGPVPPPRPLAEAIRRALIAPDLPGLSARVTFTNRLIPSADLGEGTSPLLGGASGRLWLSPQGHRLRLELQSDNGDDAQLVVNGRSFWAYDPSSRTVYEGTLPAGSDRRAAHRHDQVPTVPRISSALRRAQRHVSLSGALPGDVAGQAAYTVTAAPREHSGLLAKLALAWDAVRGVPLRLAVYARGVSDPVLELTATDISYGAVPASDFALSPPSGAKVVRISAPQHARGARHRAPSKLRLTFPLQAPAQLAGRQRDAVARMGHGALITYGQGLDGLAVLETPAAKHAAPTGRGGLQLPTVNVGGTSAEELSTPLGTLLRFTRSGVDYTVVGSVPASVALAAARAL